MRITFFYYININKIMYNNLFYIVYTKINHFSIIKILIKTKIKIY